MKTIIEKLQLRLFMKDLDEVKHIFSFVLNLK